MNVLELNVTHYLAIGSNISAAAWGRYRRGRGLPAGLLRAVGRALLPDHELAFHYYSSSWSGGALDVILRLGACVPGYLFELEPGAIEALDIKEGAPSYYERFVAEVILEDGRHVLAWVYRVCEAHRQDGHVPPAPAYLEAVLQGYSARGINDLTMLLTAAKGQGMPRPVNRIAVYGTLRRGGVRHHLLVELGAIPVTTCRLPGQLFDLGSFPGAHLNVRGNGVVAETYSVPCADKALTLLDRVEGIEGWGNQDNLFRRTLVQVPDANGRPVLAWTYVLGTPQGNWPVVADGDWIATRHRNSQLPPGILFRLPLEPDSGTAATSFAEALLSQALFGPAEDPQVDESEMFVDGSDGNEHTTRTTRSRWMGAKLCGESRTTSTIARRALGFLPGVDAIGEPIEARVRECEQWHQGVDILGWLEWAVLLPVDVLGQRATAELRWESGDSLECPPHAVEVKLWWGDEPMASCRLEGA